MSRKLPAWMSTKSKSDKNACQPSKDDASSAMTLPESYEIIYSHHYKDCCLLCDDLLSTLPRPTVVGLDTEWPINYKPHVGEQKTAVIQLCPSVDRCYIFHVSQIGSIPGPLKSLLEDASITKVGLNIAGDLWKLHRVFDNISSDVLRNHIDLCSMANSVLNTRERWSLDNLCQHLFSKTLTKDNAVRSSQWDSYPLSNAQLKYAALDAYVSLLAYLELKQRQK